MARARRSVASDMILGHRESIRGAGPNSSPSPPRLNELAEKRRPTRPIATRIGACRRVSGIEREMKRRVPLLIIGPLTVALCAAPACVSSSDNGQGAPAAGAATEAGAAGAGTDFDLGGAAGNADESAAEAGRNAQGGAPTVAPGAPDAGSSGASDDAGGASGEAGQAGAGDSAGAPSELPLSGPDGLIVKQLAASEFFTCALTVAGGVKCWGYGTIGLLGNGHTSDSTSAVDVVGLSSGVRQISAGYYHACALKQDNQIVCWGANEYQQLAIAADQLGSSVPVALAGFSAAASAIGVGRNRHSCLLDDIGKASCWGLNSSYQLGVETPASSSAPLAVTGLGRDNRQVVAGDDFSCALTGAGGVKCWGANGNGQLGYETTLDPSTEAWANSATAQTVQGLDSGVVQLAAGRIFACALTAAGGVKCWGLSQYGVLGDGSNTGERTTVPVGVSGLAAGVSQITTGIYHACAIVAQDGSVKCWGNDEYTELGDDPQGYLGPNFNRPAPVTVAGVTGALAVAAGQQHSCAALATGGVKCWGAGQLSGSGTLAHQPKPTFVSGF